MQGQESSEHSETLDFCSTVVCLWALDLDSEAFLAFKALLKYLEDPQRRKEFLRTPFKNNLDFVRLKLVLVAYLPKVLFSSYLKAEIMPFLVKKSKQISTKAYLILVTILWFNWLGNTAVKHH